MDVVTFEQTSITTSLFLNSTLRSGDDGVGVFLRCTGHAK